MEEPDFEWRLLALCRGLGNEYDHEQHPFFAEGFGSKYDQARTYCAACPVVVDCLLDIIEDRGAIGFWGATSPNERVTIRKHMDNGINFIEAVEMQWSINRKRGLPVPAKSVWKEWDY